MKYRLWKYIRYAEIAAIVVLAAFAGLTYRELSMLRKVPVALPNYEFEAATDPEKGRIVRSRGTWIAERGPPEPLQTATIECRKSSMQCVESAAMIVFVSDKGLLESAQTVFDVDRWNDTEIVTRPAAGRCSSRALVFDLVNRRAKSRISAAEEKGMCQARPEGTLELVTGFKVRAEAMQKATWF